MKYFSKNNRGTSASFHNIVSKISGVHIESAKTKSDDEANQLFTNGNDAFLQIDEKKSLRNNVAIGRFLARQGAKKDQLLGTSIFDQSKIDQWLTWTDQNVSSFAQAIIDHITGNAHEDTLDFKSANFTLRNSLKFLNGQLKDKKVLVGSEVSLADIYLACHLVRSFQLVLEPGFRKGIQHVSILKFCGLSKFI